MDNGNSFHQQWWWCVMVINHWCTDENVWKVPGLCFVISTVCLLIVLGLVFCLVFHREQTVSWAELRQASVKSPARVELSLAYSLLTVENQTKKTGPGVPVIAQGGCSDYTGVALDQLCPVIYTLDKLSLYPSPHPHYTPLSRPSHHWGLAGSNPPPWTSKLYLKGIHWKQD